MARKPDVMIEFPSRGTTYCREEFGVYEYSVYPRSSVLAGQEKRVFLDSFDTLVEAKAAFPDAIVATGTGFNSPFVGHLPDAEDWS